MTITFAGKQLADSSDPLIMGPASLQLGGRQANDVAEFAAAAAVGVWPRGNRARSCSFSAHEVFASHAAALAAAAARLGELATQGALVLTDGTTTITGADAVIDTVEPGVLGVGCTFAYTFTVPAYTVAVDSGDDTITDDPAHNDGTIADLVAKGFEPEDRYVDAA